MALTTANSNESNLNEINNFMRDAQNDLNVRVIKDETGTRRVILDKNGLRTSRPNVDVYTATDDDLYFDSNRNMFKIEKILTGSVTIPFTGSPPNTTAGSYETTVAHGLTRVPAIMPFVSPPGYNNGRQTNAPWSYFALGNVSTGGTVPGTVFLNASVDVDATNIYLKVYQRSNTDYTPDAPIYTFKVYILSETAT